MKNVDRSLINEPKNENVHATTVSGSFVTLFGETYYRIDHYDMMAPFFVTIVSSDDHWMFVATTGGLTAGRINPDHALFPYYTVDRIEENAENTGSKTILRVARNDGEYLWEPFTRCHCNPYTVERTLYKNIAGTALAFEEVNANLGLVFRYAWRTSTAFGIVKTAWLVNQGAESVAVTVTDGIQNVLPAHVAAGTQNEFSNLLDAYKRNELDTKTGLGLFSLSSRLTDLPEPSESLRANTVWQVGIEPSAHLLSSSQLDIIRAGRMPVTETDIRGQRGAYFIYADLELAPDTARTWHLVAEVDQDGAAVANLARWLQEIPDLYDAVEQDIVDSAEQLKRIVGGADGLQVSGDQMSAEHHFANVLFNVMRGGTFADQYRINKADFLVFINAHHCGLADRHADFFSALPENFTTKTLQQHAEAQNVDDRIRLW
jgi:hypothetical protein